MPHVASQASVLHPQHAGLSRRERAPEANADASPFSVLLAETGPAADPPRKQSAKATDSAPTQRSDAASCDSHGTDTRRSDTSRSQQPNEGRAADAPEAAAAAATAEQPDGGKRDQANVVAGDAQAILEVTTPVAEGASDATAEDAAAIDAAAAVVLEPPAPAGQPMVAATASLAPVAPAAAAPATAATDETGAVEPAAAPAIAAGEETTAPELPTAPQAPVPQPATQEQIAATAPPKPPAKTGTGSAASTTAAPDATSDGEEPAMASASADTTPVTQNASAQHAEGEDTPPQQTESAEKRSLPAGAQPETSERAPVRSAVSEFIQSTNAPADGAHLAHLQTGRDFGQAVAATAHASQSADASNPTVSAPVPLETLAVEIAARAQGGRNRFEIRLDPPELGRIEVRLDIDRSGNVTSRLVVDKAETLDILRRDAHQLERALQDAGLKTSDNSLQFSLRDQSFAGRNDQDGSGRQMHIVDPELQVTETAPLVYGQMLRGGGGIDIRV